MHPQCVVEFIDSARSGVEFRLKDRRGRYCTDVVHFHRYTEDLLTKAKLDSRVRLTTRWSKARPAASLKE